jgi:hypothetical protein
MRGVVCSGQLVLVGQSRIGLFQPYTNRIRTAVKPRHDVSFAPYPFSIIRRAAAQRAVEKRLTKPLYFDRYRQAPGGGKFAQSHPKLPRRFFVKFGEDQLLLLLSNYLKIFAQVHQLNSTLILCRKVSPIFALKRAVRKAVLMVRESLSTPNTPYQIDYRVNKKRRREFFATKSAAETALSRNPLNWPISDEVTVQITSDFYEAAHKSGNAPEALAEVQRNWLLELRIDKGIAQAVNLAGPFIMSSQGKP